ncbi:hypothetical protein BJV77DRAFT_1067251 [Russula vinacea]|nr:hypothetical protein BJV77DRAFT_1067251 [Russula vinacea]
MSMLSFRFPDISHITITTTAGTGTHGHLSNIRVTHVNEHGDHSRRWNPPLRPVPLYPFGRHCRRRPHGEEEYVLCLDGAAQQPRKLSSSPTIRSRLTALYDKLLEQNLLRNVEIFSL